MHGDIKPHNILKESEETGSCYNKETIYLIDFGISEKYLDSNGIHMQISKRNRFHGNMIFSSHN